MSDAMEIFTGILIFVILVWPIAGFILVMRWIGRQEREALANLSHQEENLS